jgi:hypothetical protein
MAALVTAGCGPGTDADSPPPLHATVSASTGTCSGAQAYQHATLEYRVCYSAGWVTRDYTAEPGSGGALSVVAFGPAEKVPQHVPAGVEYAPPLDVRVIAGPKSTIEPSLAQGEQVQSVTVGAHPADRIEATQAGPGLGAIFVLIEYQDDTYIIEKAPGSDYRTELDAMIRSFVFAAAGG